jgi:ligand-binding sensor domain-containing protein
LFSPGFGQCQALVFQKLEQANGLSDELNAHFVLDKDGFFWTSSRQGLNRFDGKEVKVFRPTHKGEVLPPNITSQIFEDQKKNIWFTSATSLHCLFAQTDSIQSRQFFEDQNEYYYAFYLELDSILWMVANQQLYTIDITSNELTPNFIGRFDVYNATAITDQDGKVVSLFRPGVEKGDGFELIQIDNARRFSQRDTFFTSSTLPKYPSSRISFIQIENDSSYWIPSYDGLIHFNPYKIEEYKIYRHEQSRSNQKLYYIDAALWKDQFLWITSRNNGLLQFDLKSKTFIKQDSVFYFSGQEKIINSLFRVHIDETETLWFSVPGQGIYFTNLPNNKFDFIPSSSGSNSNNEISSLVETTQDGILYSVKDKIAHIDYSKPAGQSKQSLPTVSEPIVRMTNDLNGNHWIITTKNIFQWNAQSNQIKTKVKDINRVYDIIQPTKNTYWLFDDFNIYELKNQENSVNLPELNKIDSTLHLPGQLLFDRHSRLVFLSQSDNSLKVYQLQSDSIAISQLKNVGVVNGLSSVNKDTIWFASSTGLYVFDTKTQQARKVIHDSGLLDRSFTDVVVDTMGTVWLSSYFGIYRYTPVKNSVDHFTQSDGLISMQYQKNVSLYGNDGRIYFGGDKGITVIDPKTVQLNSKLPNIKLLEVSVNNQLIDLRPFLKKRKRPVSFKYAENSLDFKFGILDYSDPGSVDFKYYLIKNGQDTILVGKSNPIELKLLPAGIYRIDLYASNSDAIWSKDPKIIQFKIQPPWYATWWARTLSVLIILGIIYSIYKNRIRQIREKEAARRQEAELKQMVAETETEVLRLQMNPHFIFNSMNSINSYILKKDISTASDFLQRFSKLMRLILERSNDEFTDLEEEIELLTYYLETEAMRLKKPLQFQFEIGEGIDPQEILLPTMILQPFIENSIWHGISPKKEGGKIVIRFLVKNELLVCEVEDNGVGRSFHKNTQNRTHKSKALEITKKRLELLSGKMGADFRYEIHDLYNDQNFPKGTLVQLYLPVID